MLRLLLPSLALLMLVSALAADPRVGGPSENGKAVMCDLPMPLRLKNIGGRDGAGLCVFTSNTHSARDQHELPLWNFQKQMSQEPGGGWPDKVDQMIQKYAPGVRYLQYEGTDPSILEAALKSGRMPGVTYDGRDPHYGVNHRIAHMVNLVYLDQGDAAILDNNFIGDDQLVWMSRAEFLDRWKGRENQGWTVILLAPSPAPVPKLIPPPK